MNPIITILFSLSFAFLAFQLIADGETLLGVIVMAVGILTCSILNFNDDDDRP